MVHTRI